MYHIIFMLLMVESAHGYMGAVMGQLTECDDAKSYLNVDWDPKDFTQFSCPNEMFFPRLTEARSVSYEIPDFNPRTDVVYHRCMNETLVYKDRLPLRGEHRPNWGRYGEYLYIPSQRWLHNLEHGTIVLLYHPCVDRTDLNSARSIVKNCLWRHVITPYNKLTQERPMALVSWGAKYEFNVVDQFTTQEMIKFIKQHAKVAPEDINRDGLYDSYLIEAARIVSDKDDSIICPGHNVNPENIEIPNGGNKNNQFVR